MPTASFSQEYMQHVQKRPWKVVGQLIFGKIRGAAECQRTAGPMEHGQMKCQECITLNTSQTSTTIPKTVK